MKDFLIKYHIADIKWAEFITSQLEETGYVILNREIDFQNPKNLTGDLIQSRNLAKKIILLLSPDFLNSYYAIEDWLWAFDPDNDLCNFVIPVYIKDCYLELLFPQLHCINLIDLPIPAAGKVLLNQLESYSFRIKSIMNESKSNVQSLIIGLPKIWNVPYFRNPEFIGRESVLIKMRKELTSTETLSKKIVLYGLGGIGKSSLAVEYANRYAGFYSVVWWLRSENSVTLAEDLSELALRLNLPFIDKENPETMLRALIKEFQNYSNWLLIYDNADSPDEIKKLIPEKSKTHIIITSRFAEWGEDYKCQKISVLRRNESVMFIQKQTGQKCKISSNKLAEELSDLPLALNQVCAYIKNKNISLKDYLSLLKNYKRNFSEFVVTNSDYPVTLKASMNMTFQHIRKISKKAMNLLNFFSFLSSEDISFLEYSQKNVNLPQQIASMLSQPQEFKNVMDILEKYSLIKIEENSLSIHRLIQKMIQESMPDIIKMKWTDITLRTINFLFDFKKDDVESWSYCSRLLPHALSIAELCYLNGNHTKELGELSQKLGDFMINKCKYKESLHFLRKSLIIFIKKYGKTHNKVADVLHGFGLVYQELGKYNLAKKVFILALRIDKKRNVIKNPKICRDLNSIGNVLWSINKMNKAYEHFEQALRLNQLIYGDYHKEVARNLNNLGLVSKYLEDYEQALLYLNRALDINKKSYGSIHPSLSDAYLNLGSVYRKQGKINEAKELYKKALEIDYELYGKNHSKVSNKLLGLGQILLESGELKGALNLFKKALSIHRVLYGNNHFYIAFDFTYIGDVTLKQGNPIIAGIYYKHALTMLNKFFDQNHPNYIKVKRRIEKVQQDK